MKNLRFFPLLAIIALFVSMSSFRFTAGAVAAEETRELPAFTKIGLAYPAHVVLKKGKTQRVQVQGTAEQLSNLITEVKEGRLSIRRKDTDQYINFNSKEEKGVTIHITVPQLEAVAVSGSGTVKSEDTFKATALDLAVSGSGSIYITAQTDNVTSRISGSGSIELKGEGKQSTVSLSGSGSLKSFGFNAANTKVSVSGSGTCEVSATSTLKSSISGSGRVYYEGTPATVDSRISGSGALKRRS